MMLENVAHLGAQHPAPLDVLRRHFLFPQMLDETELVGTLAQRGQPELRAIQAIIEVTPKSAVSDTVREDRNSSRR